MFNDKNNKESFDRRGQRNFECVQCFAHFHAHHFIVYLHMSSYGNEKKCNAIFSTLLFAVNLASGSRQLVDSLSGACTHRTHTPIQCPLIRIQFPSAFESGQTIAHMTRINNDIFNNVSHSISGESIEFDVFGRLFPLFHVVTFLRTIIPSEA